MGGRDADGMEAEWRHNEARLSNEKDPHSPSVVVASRHTKDKDGSLFGTRRVQLVHAALVAAS